MDTKELTTYLKEKLKKSSIEIVSPKKDDGSGDRKAKEGGEEKKVKEGGGGDKKEKENGGEKKETESKSIPSGGGEGSKGVEGAKVEVINKMEYQSFNPQTYYAMPMYNQSYSNQDYGMPMYHHQDHQNYHNTGYAVQYTNG
ncbi:hypothetical protein ABTP16_17560, partial [Acinetobacter baumannii]